MARRRRYYHGGAFSMVMICAILAIITAFVATYVYASMDASREIVSGDAPDTVPIPRVTLSGDSDGDTTTTKVPELLTDDELASRVAASVRAVITRDEAGQRVQGTAFVVGSFSGQTYLLTSFDVVRASTKAPGPGIQLDGGQNASLWTWQEDRDLALLVVNGQIESLPWATAPPAKGEKIWAGGAGQKLTAGIVLATSDTGVDTNIFVDDVRQGAPLVTQRGEVVGMASRIYNPNNRGTDSQFIAVPIKLSCDRLLRCGGGSTQPGQTNANAVTPTTARR